ncbi:MAG: sugar phosphate isomerase/epimerase family protein [Planctomycetota bacterium]
MARIPIGLQLYSVREECARDLPAVLDQVAEMGYEGVEFPAGGFGQEARPLRDMLDDRGLRCCGCHTPVESLQADRLEATVDFALQVGSLYLICPWLPEDWRDSLDAWARAADFFNGVADDIRSYGLRVGYHNHSFEFQPIGGGPIPWVVLGEKTTCDVILQLDTGNCMAGGGDPVAMLERFPGRSITVHLKEYSATEDAAVIGEGDVAWEKVFVLCEQVGNTEWFIVEQETYPCPPLECARRCLDALRAMGA